MNAPDSKHLPLDTGLTYHALEWPADSDHSVFLVHGFLDAACSWEMCSNEGLAGHFHLVAPDMRGHGDSDRIGQGGYYHFLDYVADLASLIEKLGRDRVSLVGHSMGGTIAGYYAGAFSDRVHKLVLLEGVGPPVDNTPAPARLQRWVHEWKKGRKREPRVYESTSAAAERLMKHDPLLESSVALSLAKRMTRESGTGVAFKHDPLHLSRGPYPFRTDYAESMWRAIRCPVLAIEGTESRFTSSGAEDRYRAFTQLERRQLSGAGHMMHRHQPAALAEHIVEFLGNDAS